MMKLRIATRASALALWQANVDSRLRRLDGGDFAAIVLACAGLKRLGHGDRISATLDRFVPAIGQGALAIECRKDDSEIAERLLPLDHLPTRYAVTGERG